MESFERIAFVKTGWAERYDGDAVKGRHGWISEHQDAHERFNFLAAADNLCHAYLPPTGTAKVPNPKVREGWLVIFTAALEGDGKLVPVGWYEEATFEKRLIPRPEYDLDPGFPRDVRGEPYCYAITSKRAFLIPAENRSKFHVPGRPHFGQAPILYARGGASSEDWRREYADLAERIVLGEATTIVPELVSSTAGFAGAEHSREVERKSVAFVMQYFDDREYEVCDRQSKNCGYDLLVTKSAPSEELHVEVKGTSCSSARFFMTPNEKAYMEAHPLEWRLAMVTSTLDNPKLEILTAGEVEERFELEPRVWGARERPSP